MTNLREAAQMALDAFDSDNPDIQLRAATHLRAALAQPEQDPVAWGVDEGEGRCIDLHDVYFVPTDAEHMAELKGNHAKVIPLYTAPPQREWQGLTDEEVKATWSELWYDLGNGKFAASDDSSRHTTVMFAKAIEAKLREKNSK